MSKKMLVDASHPEETRVVVLSGSRVEEFDYENAERLQLKGNIYLAKVTRVEPSLQACFVEYGGNRHGFLPFSEIHPDYYRIPKEDRVALMAAERASERRSYDDEDEDEQPQVSQTASSEPDSSAAPQSDDQPPSHAPVSSNEWDTPVSSDATDASEFLAQDDRYRSEFSQPTAASSDADAETNAEDGQDQSDEQATQIETVESAVRPEDIETIGSEDALEEVPSRKQRHVRRYKIQEVIARKQILLIQVVKEERGSKGAALTTFLSLAGRYCVLMPNTDRGGGISRKIANPADRRKLKELAQDLDVPDGMGLIIRTAGANRTKQEVKRDFEYLLREWDAVRDLTLKSSAPTLVYEEGSLIKRAIRDLFSKDIDQILVEGDAGHEEARDFMRLIMPSHMAMVEKFAEPLPLYQAYGVEAQLDSMFQPTVRLRSGGYIVINQTEALVAVDVNSGKSTREHNIEDTALKTNLEAADEVARQLRLRDLAGLIVIDFIDMEEGRNNRHVEKRLKDALKNDRARIQVGRISPFGLLEMSRQRLRSGMVEGSTVQCAHCEGRGSIRSVGSMALRILRAVEEHCQRQKETAITLRLPPEIAIYILNHKRSELSNIEERHSVYIYIESKPSLTASTYEIERGAPVMPEPRRVRRTASAVSLGAVFEEYPIENEPVEDEDSTDDVEENVTEVTDTEARTNGRDASPNEQVDRQGRKRRRRRGRGRDGRDAVEGGERPNPQSQSHQPRVPHQPRPALPERPLGVPSPADFNFEHHDWPDTSPDALDAAPKRQPFNIGADDDQDFDGPRTEGLTADAAPSNPNLTPGEREQERRNRRGRRGRRGRGRDRDGTRTDQQQRDGAPGQGDRTEARQPRPLPESGILAETSARGEQSYAHPALIRPEPQFGIAQTPPTHTVRADTAPARREYETATSSPSQRPEQKAEPKSDWNLASFFGFGSKDASKDVVKEPVRSPAPPPAPAPTPVRETPKVEPVADAPQQSEGPKKGGWWQRKA